MAFFDDQADPYAALGTTVSHPRRPAPPPQAPPRPAGQFSIVAAPPMATPQPPGQEASSYGSAAASNAAAERNHILTPVEAEHLRLQNAADARAFALERARLEAASNQLLTVGNHYIRSYRDSSWAGTLPDWLSPDNQSFDSEAANLADQGFMAFRVPGQGPQSDADAARFAQANQPSSHSFDSTNEAKLDALIGRLNGNRAIYGLPPVDWRQGGPIPINQANQQAVQAADPNRVQHGESMGQVGTLPIVPGADSSHNELNNEGGAYVTPQDREIAGVLTALANSHLSAADTIAQANNILRARGIHPLSPEAEASIYSARRNRSRHPGFSPYPTGRSDPNLVTGMANTGYGAGVVAAGDALTMGTLDNMTADPERTRAGMELLREQHPWASTVGEMAGSLLPGTAAERAASMGIRRIAGEANLAARGAGEARTIGEMAVRPTGNAAYGAGYGAGTADQNGGGFMERLAGAGRGALTSAIGGEVGDRAVAGLGRAATGSRNAAVRRLTEAGVPLSIGQIASGGGRAARIATGVENVLESVPWLGDAIRARRQDSFNGVNRAAFNEALAPIGANTGGVVGEEGAGIARSAVSDAYSKALDHVVVPVDANFGKELTGAISLGQRLPPDLQGHFRTFIENRVAPQIMQGQITGTGYQALRQEIRQELTAIRGQLGEREYGAAMKRVGDALERVVRRNAPDAVPALNAADQAYRGTRVVEGAVGRAINNKEQGGVFTPAQLGTEARANANRFGNNGGTTQRPFYNLQRDAQNALPSSLPNSGTTDRAWVLAAFPAIVSGGLGATGVIDPSTAALFAGLGIPYSRTGQQMFQKMLVSRPDAVRRAGEAIIAQRRWGGRAGAGAVNPTTDQTPSPNGR